MRFNYYKLRQLSVLQSAMVSCYKLRHGLLEIATGITKCDGFRDGPLEKLWGGEGNFQAAGIFFRYQIPCMNIFQALA